MTPSFSIFALGTGGGPLENNLSSYLCKPYDTTWEYGNVFALEAGSGIGTLAQLLRDDNELLHYFGLEPSVPPTIAAARVFSAVHTYLISHAHFDHISALVLSAGSLSGEGRKHITGMHSVLLDIETVFSGRLWPKLATWKQDDDESSYLLTTLHQNQYQRLCPNVSVRMMPLTHGQTFTEPKAPYESSAFFIRHDLTKRTFIFFGDVEPDSMSLKPQTIEVWRVAARMIPDELTTIFLECSWPSGRDDSMLFGHLSPKYVLRELEALADEVLSLKAGIGVERLFSTRKQQTYRRGALKGLTLYLVHCKAALNGAVDQAQLIARQVQTLVQEQELGIDVAAVTQGMCIG